MTPVPSEAIQRRRRWARALRARRRWVAVLLLTASVAFALDALAPAAPATDPVVVAAHALAPGATLNEGDVRLAAWPTALVPADAIRSIAETSGRVLAGAVGEGEALTGLRLVGPALTAAIAGAGRVAAPVRLADAATARLLRPGDRVDVVAAQAGTADPISGGTAPPGARVVAAAALVITVAPDTQPNALIGSTSGGALVVLALSRTEALAVAEASVLGPISVLLVG